MGSSWRRLKVGDHVRVVAWPNELIRSRLHQETIDFYERLISTGAVLKVVRHDHFGIPYGELREVDETGMKRWDEVGLNHGAIVVVESERQEG